MLLPSNDITQKEFNVAYWIAHGKSTKEAARINKVPVSTVLQRLKDVYRKLGVHGRMDLAKAFEQGRF